MLPEEYGDLLAALMYTNQLLKTVSIVAYTDVILPHLPYGLKEELIEFNKSINVEATIKKYK